VPVRTPSYRLHRPTGQAVVTLNGRDVYLGKYDTPASRAEYDRVVAEWLVNGRQLGRPGGAGDLTVTELILAYFRFAEGYYRKNGAPTTEVESIRVSLRPLRRLYGPTPARDFGPLALKAVRQAFVDSGLCRNEVNKRAGRVVRCFKWAVENEMIPPGVHHGLKAVAGLRKGRSGVRESEPVKPVPEAFVDAVRPHVARQVWAMIELQRLTGMRPGEVVIMRTCDLDTAGAVWVYTPSTHKTEHHDRSRQIFLGPRAQDVLRPWLRTDLSAFLFSPREAMEERSAARRRARRTPLTPSQRARTRKADPGRAPGERYDTHSYHIAVRRGCQAAGVPTWGPNRLRHNAATRLRREFGLDVARVILGHSSPAVTEVYAEVDRVKAIEVMGRVG
jgi:integrase